MEFFLSKLADLLEVDKLSPGKIFVILILGTH